MATNIENIKFKPTDAEKLIAYQKLKKSVVFAPGKRKIVKIADFDIFIIESGVNAMPWKGRSDTITRSGLQNQITDILANKSLTDVQSLKELEKLFNPAGIFQAVGDDDDEAEGGGNYGVADDDADESILNRSSDGGTIVNMSREAFTPSATAKFINIVRTKLLPSNFTNLGLEEKVRLKLSQMSDNNGTPLDPVICQILANKLTENDPNANYVNQVMYHPLVLLQAKYISSHQ